MYILLYVDDLFLAGTNDKQVDYVKKVLSKNFKMSNLGEVKHFLGMVISQNLTECQTFINQIEYRKNILSKFNMQDYKSALTPMDVNFKHSILKRDKSENVEIELKCKMLIGSIDWYDSIFISFTNYNVKYYRGCYRTIISWIS